MQPLKITFHLDGRGMYYDEIDPPMLDAMIGFALAKKDLYHDETPSDLDLPLAKWHIDGYWGYKASGLFPVESDAPQKILMFRKKFNARDADSYMVKSSPQITGGPYRENNQPLLLLLTKELYGYCVGDAAKIHAVLREIRYVGRRRSLGLGRVLKVETMPIDSDWSCVKNGKAMRPLPQASALRHVRCRPPYWHMHDRVPVCEIGDDYILTS